MYIPVSLFSTKCTWNKNFHRHHQESLLSSYILLAHSRRSTDHQNPAVKLASILPFLRPKRSLAIGWDPFSWPSHHASRSQVYPPSMILLPSIRNSPCVYLSDSPKVYCSRKISRSTEVFPPPIVSLSSLRMADKFQRLEKERQRVISICETWWLTLEVSLIIVICLSFSMNWKGLKAPFK